MKYQEARAILSKPLRFGDETQLAAMKFLRDFEVARNRLMLCRHCLGEGLMRDGTLCEWCAVEFEPDVRDALGIDAREKPP